MHKLLITEAGASPSENVIRSWKTGQEEQVIGVSRNPFHLFASVADEKRHIPYEYAFGPQYEMAMVQLLEQERPSLAVFMSDYEILAASGMRASFEATGTKLFMPDHHVIDTCTDKYLSYQKWEKAGITVPKTVPIATKEDLKAAFKQLGNEDGKIWLRSTVGAGGKGALPTNDYEFAVNWIELYNGWGNFTASKLLKADKTVTWLSIWHEGELVVAQTRLRKSWGFGNRTLSGVTGITGVGETYASEMVDEIALATVRAVDDKPHGVYGVDMTYDENGIPNPTEINMRFFTTNYFFTQAGLNMPKIYKDIALYGKFPVLEKKMNPLPSGLLWIRDMDRAPVLTTMEEIEQLLGTTRSDAPHGVK